MTEPLVYRANIRTAKGNQYPFALEHNCFGFGWAIPSGVTDMGWDQYSKAAKRKYHGNPQWSRHMDMIHGNLAPGDLIWIRDDAAKFHLGRITSRWHYVAEAKYLNADLVNICDCEWQKPYTLDDVPGSLMQCRGAFREVTDEHLVEYTKLLYCEAAGIPYVPGGSEDGPPNLFKWLSDSACEDLVALYLQHGHGYSVIPSTSKHSTAKYEWAMIHRETGHEASVQVKNGEIPLDCTAYSAAGFKVFLFTSGGEYRGSLPPNVEIISKDSLVDFAQRNRQGIPKTIRRWVDHLYQN